MSYQNSFNLLYLFLWFFLFKHFQLCQLLLLWFISLIISPVIFVISNFSTDLQNVAFYWGNDLFIMITWFVILCSCVLSQKRAYPSPHFASVYCFTTLILYLLLKFWFCIIGISWVSLFKHYVKYCIASLCCYINSIYVLKVHIFCFPAFIYYFPGVLFSFSSCLYIYFSLFFVSFYIFVICLWLTIHWVYRHHFYSYKMNHSLDFIAKEYILFKLFKFF